MRPYFTAELLGGLAALALGLALFYGGGRLGRWLEKKQTSQV